MAALVTAEDCFVSKPKEQEEEIERIYDECREMVLKFPTMRAWCGMPFQQYKGFWFQPIFGLEGLMYMRQHFQAKPTDVYLTSKPKSGTTWLKSLVFAILNRTRYSFSNHPLLTISPHECVPFLEHLFRITPIADPEILPSPRIFATHTPFSLLPESVKSSSCKVVYICRDPKDVLISLWHYMNRVWAKKLSSYTSLEEAFDLFCKGVTPCGPYWDHVSEYLQASLDYPKKLLFLKYEEMKKDPFCNVKRLAEFLGQPFSLKEEEQGVVQEIVKLCSFESMRNMEMTKSKIKRVEIEIRNDVYFRQGKVGDWKNYLTEDMIECLDQIMKQKLKDYGLTFSV